MRPVRGVLSVAIEARRVGRKKLVVPIQNASEAAMVAGIDVYGVRNLREAFTLLTGENPLEPLREDLAAFFASHSDYDVDFADVRGQNHVKRAIEIAASGGHGLLVSVVEFTGNRFPSSPARAAPAPRAEHFPAGCRIIRAPDHQH